MIEVVIVEYADIQDIMDIMENSERIRPSQHFLSQKPELTFYLNKGEFCWSDRIILSKENH